MTKSLGSRSVAMPHRIPVPANYFSIIISIFRKAIYRISLNR